jgi:protein-disulfide isomerase
MSSKKTRNVSKKYKKLQKTGNKNYFIIGIVALALAFMVTAYLVLSNSSSVLTPGIGDNPDADTSAEAFEDGPRNMPLDGFTITNGFVSDTPTEETVKSGTVFSAADYVPREDGKTTVRIYIDPQCPICNTFEKTNSELLEEYIAADKIVLEYHPISFLDQASSTEYSSRATNALACVADLSPDNFYSFINVLFLNQPAEGGKGLSNGEIYALTEKAGVPASEELETCVYSKQFGPWVTEATERVLTSGSVLPGTFNGVVQGTPAVFMNGNQMNIDPADGVAFKTALDEVIANS